MAGWTHEVNLLREELVQRADEGCTIPAWLRDRVEQLHPDRDGYQPVVTDPLWEALARLEPDPALAAAEPNDLAAIRALRPAGPRDLGWEPTPEALLDRLQGAWAGRCAGCALGKPVENGDTGMAKEGRRSVGRHRIRAYLEARGEWPLRDYFSGESKHPTLRLRGCQLSQREHIAFMEPDDDIHYTLIGLAVLEDSGPDFVWHEVARSWTRRLPLGAICTAETQAILNFWNRSNREGSRQSPNTGATPAYTRSHKNPYREWIGAQIRADGWAWAAAGKPELAAEFAWRDAHWTHTRNGIYGEMFFAAVQAAAFVEHDPRRLLEIGLSEIPRDCRLARWIRAAMEWPVPAGDFWAAFEVMDTHPTLVEMHVVHTINNAVVCALAMLHAPLRVDDAAAVAVMGGLDTDCNGATVGGIAGAACGYRALESRLVPRLNDTVRPLVFGFTEVTMRTLAERHAAVWQKVHAWHRARAQA